MKQHGTLVVPSSFPPDIPFGYQDIITRVAPYTCTSVERLASLIQAVDYVSSNNVPGAFVECGVWKGGSSMAAMLRMMMLRMMQLGEARDCFLFDTFEGMSEPTGYDVAFDGTTAADDGHSMACSLDDVKTSIGAIGYDASRIHYVKGKVEETLPHDAVRSIAILRLDTDWYESTRHELNTLWPLVSEGGILIIDDYGHWQGARKAVDEFFAGKRAFLHRIDYTGRLVVKA